MRVSLKKRSVSPHHGSDSRRNSRKLCREVIPTSKPVRTVAEADGVRPESLCNRLTKYRAASGGTDEELTVKERARLDELERENQELKAETASLK